MEMWLCSGISLLHTKGSEQTPMPLHGFWLHLCFVPTSWEHHSWRTEPNTSCFSIRLAVLWSHTMLSAASMDFGGKLKLCVTLVPQKWSQAASTLNWLKASQGRKSEPNPKYGLKIIMAICLISACGDVDEFPFSHLIQDCCSGVGVGRSCLQHGNMGSRRSPRSLWEAVAGGNLVWLNPWLK